MTSEAADRPVTLAANRTALTIPLLDGEIPHAGFVLDAVESKSIDDTSRRMLELELDFAEVSFGTFIRGRDRGVPLVALPIFTNSRQFLNVNLHVAARAQITDLAELRGRTIGASQYWTASSLWQRHFLHALHGLAAEDMSWVTFQPERMDGLEVPDGVQHRLEAAESPDDLAGAGKLHAFTTASGRRRDGGGPSALAPFFKDRAAAQREYYEQTGVYPVQYVVVTRTELADGEPRLVSSVCEAFLRAKELAAARGPLAPADLTELLGDAWPYGLTANRKTLEVFVAEAHRQGATSRLFGVDELFASELPPSMQ